MNSKSVTRRTRRGYEKFGNEINEAASRGRCGLLSLSLFLSAGIIGETRLVLRAITAERDGTSKPSSIHRMRDEFFQSRSAYGRIKTVQSGSKLLANFAAVERAGRFIFSRFARSLLLHPCRKIYKKA